MMLNTLIELTKPRITIASTLTAAVGYTLARGRIDLNIIPVLIGGFLLASGSAALNQVQESDIDAKVERTLNRPIPSGKITSRLALQIALSLLIIGFLILYMFYNWKVASIGVSAAILYNFVYTPLKRISPSTAIKNGLTGSAEGLSLDQNAMTTAFPSSVVPFMSRKCR